MALSIRQAAAQGISRIRSPNWASKFDHIRIDLLEGNAGPWVHLYSPVNLSVNGRDPVDVLRVEVDYSAEEYEAYEGPLPSSEEYISESVRAARNFNQAGETK